MQKKNVTLTRICGPARHYGVFPKITLVSTNSQDATGKALSLQDIFCLVSFII